MRDLVIAKLKEFIVDSLPYGIPRSFDCDEEENITNFNELDTMSDQQLLEIFEATVGFGG